MEFDDAILLVKKISSSLSKEEVQEKFEKYGPNEEHATRAKINLNNTILGNQQISISAKFQIPEKKQQIQPLLKEYFTQTKEKQHSQILDFGEIESLILKQSQIGDNRLGYGYVEFKKEEAYSKILKEQAEQGKIKIEQLNSEFRVKLFNNQNKTKGNYLHFFGHYPEEIKAEQKEEKLQQINNLFEEVKKNINKNQEFYHYSEYDEDELNFSTYIEFAFSNSNEQGNILKIICDAVFQKFPSVRIMPIIKEKNYESENDLKVIWLGIKYSVNQENLMKWLEKYLNIKISIDNIIIEKRLLDPIFSQQAGGYIERKPSCSVTFFLESMDESDQVMDFINKPENLMIRNEIFDVPIPYYQDEVQKVINIEYQDNKINFNDHIEKYYEEEID